MPVRQRPLEPGPAALGEAREPPVVVDGSCTAKAQAGACAEQPAGAADTSAQEALLVREASRGEPYQKPRRRR